jgi:hypothetical protein
LGSRRKAEAGMGKGRTEGRERKGAHASFCLSVVLGI